MWEGWRAVAWTTVGRAVQLAAGLALWVVVARWLDPGDAGAVFVVVSLAAIGAKASQLGYDLLVFEVGPGEELRDLAVVAARRVWIASIGGGLVVGAAASAVSSSLPLMPALLAAVLLVVPRSLQMLVGEVVRVTGDIRSASIHGGAFGITASVVMLSVAIRTGFVLHATSALLTLAVGWLIALPAALRMLPTSNRPSSGSFANGSISGRAKTLWVGTLALLALGHVDVWFAALWHGEEAGAVYGVALRLAMLVGVPVQVVNAAFVHRIIRELGRKQILQRRVSAMATASAIPALILLVGWLLLGGSVLTWVFGEFYAASFGPLMVLSLGAFASSVTGASGTVLIASGHRDTYRNLSVGVVMVTLIAAITLGRFSLMSMSVVFASGLAMQNAGSAYLVKRLVGVLTLPSWRPADVRWLLFESRHV